jgi:hypothetical protein
MPLPENLMQASALNVRKAYKHSASALPRIASSIGTSNREDLLVECQAYAFLLIRIVIGCLLSMFPGTDFCA